MKLIPQISSSHRAISLIAVVTVASATVFWAVSRTMSPPSAIGHIEESLSIEGLHSPFEVKRYAKLADLVVVGTPVAENVHQFTENAQIPESAKSDEMYATAGYYDVTVQVNEYMKGKGPEQLSIRRLAPPPDVMFGSSVPEPQLNQTYVFFLQTGTELWTGGYLALGQESLGAIEVDIVDFPDRKITVKQLREEVKSAEEDKGENKP